MTELLEKAFAEAASLPEQDQNSFADWILAELASERKWGRAFAQSAVGVLRADEIVWFFIGPHSDYDALLRSL